MPAQIILGIPSLLAPVAKHCWEKAAPPTGWNLTFEQFERALGVSVAHRFQGMVPGGGDQNANPPDTKAIQSYLESLHVADLALACACSAGSDEAWDFFVRQFRPELYRAARSIAGEGGGPRFGRFVVCGAVWAPGIGRAKKVVIRLFPRPQQTRDVVASTSLATVCR